MPNFSYYAQYYAARLVGLGWKLRILMGPKPAEKTISAMVRVKNEQEYIESSVLSIIDLVDEVVIVDNQSSDDTPKIIQKLASKYPDKIKLHTYNYTLARQGAENAHLSAKHRGEIPELLSSFYNFCVGKCNHPYILKWDADTIATEAMAHALADFRKNSKEILWHIGANVHENREALIAGHPYEDCEPRLFRKQYAYYDNEQIYYETLQSPFLRSDFDKYSERCPEILYVHMKYCKSDRFSNVSEDLRQRAIENNKPGVTASRDVLETLSRWVSAAWFVVLV